MTKRKLFILAGAAVLLLLLIVARHRKPASAQQDGMVQLTVVPFEINGGWGYKVMMDNKPYIYQDVIPGVAGNQAFHSKEDAQRVGNLVLEKMMQHKLPAVTLTELMKMQVAGIQ
ncbi:DUF4907 domain-containing protein [Chitinophaga sp. HK235]|uniref:DUF4907 domain-containing protein n=1 Tax=Chitinophaga sp. HK235 TaxID=2952571 RepID=UPI001BA80BEA|nr:DUF4907 domain-containing protein [Chitinophaga sp. HK235]